MKPMAAVPLRLWPGAILLAAVTLALPARAWWPKGHSLVAAAAVRSLPPEVPAFFRAGAGQVAHCAQDPDVIKIRELQQISDREHPEHFLDQELLQGRPLPPTRYQFEKLCRELKVEPEKVGFAPYAIAEWTQRLAAAFAEHRRWPKNPYIRNKCLVYAGILSHYSGDLCQPLHVTIEFDGRKGPEGTTSHTGIHAGVDAALEKLPVTIEELARDQKVEPMAALMPAILLEMESSRALIDRVYALERQWPPAQGEWKATPEVAAFTRERGREATRFTASLYLTAWRASATVKLPPWLERESEPESGVSRPQRSQRSSQR
jgi:hypothetical protein